MYIEIAPSRSFSTPKEVPAQVGIMELLVYATFAPNRAVPFWVRSIELGLIGDHARSLLTASLQDPDGKEYGKRIFVNNRRHIEIERAATKGHQHFVNLPYPSTPYRGDYSLPRIYWQDRFSGLVAHSHGHVDSPASAKDFTTMLFHDKARSATTGILLITPGQIMLALRGDRAPQWEEELARQRTATWTTSFYEVVTREITQSPVARLGYLGAEERQRIHVLENARLMRIIAEKLDLRIYTCAANQNVTHLQSA